MIDWVKRCCRLSTIDLSIDIKCRFEYWLRSRIKCRLSDRPHIHPIFTSQRSGLGQSIA